jgi:outer membrane protein assembly factor BamB
MAWRRPARWLALATVVTAASAPAASAQDATSFQQDHAHTGRLDASSPAPPLVQRWSHDLGANTSYPLIVDRRVFVAALHGSVYGPVLYAFDLATGAELWSRRQGGASMAMSYHAGLVLVQDDIGVLRAYDPATGRRRWATVTGGDYQWYPGPPVASGDLVYAHEGNAVEVATGRVRWTNGAGDSHPRQVLAGGLVASVTYCNLRARDAASGASAWTTRRGCSGGSAVIPVASEDEIWMRDFDTLIRYEAATGQPSGPSLTAWRPPSFAPDMVLASGSYDLVAHRRSDSAELWRFTPGARLVTAATVVGSHVYVGAADALYALRLTDGSVEWSTPLSAEPASREEFLPVGMNAGNGHLVVPLKDGRIIAFADPDATVLPAPPPPAPDPLDPVPAPSATVGFRLDPARSAALPGPDPKPPLRLLWSVPMTRSSYPVIAEGRVHVVDRDPSGSTLRTFDVATGAPLWSRQVAAAGRTQVWRPLWHAGRVIIQGSAGEVAAFDAATGTPLWEIDLVGLDPPPFQPPLAIGNVVYAFGGGTHAIDLETGARLWSGSGGQGTPALYDGVFYFTLACHQMVAVSAQDGARLWGGHSCGAGGTQTAARDGRVYVRDREEGMIRRASDGAQIDGFSATIGPAIGAGLVITANRTTIEAHDEDTGVRRWTTVLPASDPYTTVAAPILVGSTVYTAVASGGHVFALDADTGAALDEQVVGSGVPTLADDGGSGGLGAGDGVLVVPAVDRLVAYGTDDAAPPPPDDPTVQTAPAESGEPGVAAPTEGADPVRIVSSASARPPATVVADLARSVRTALRRHGLRALRLNVPAMAAGRLSVELRAGRRLARAAVTTDPARAVTLRLRPLRHAAARRVVVVVRYGETARRLVVRVTPRGSLGRGGRATRRR